MQKILFEIKHWYVLKKYPLQRKIRWQKILISSKYESLLNSDTWGNDVLPELNNMFQIVDSNIRETNYMDIQNDNILEHLFLMKNECNWFGPFGICDQLKFYPNQIEFLSFSVKTSLIIKKI
jgi:hypothetical protein